MESIIIYLWDTNEEKVASFLQDAYPFQKGPPWIDELDGDACLYINFYHDLHMEHDSNEIAEIRSLFGSEPSVIVIADISGRHLGQQRERNFVRSLMTRFKAMAQDDFTSHLWTLEEINSQYLVQGHTFFDYKGWYETLKKD